MRYWFMALLALLAMASCKTNELVFIQDKSVLFAEDEKDSLYLTSPSDYLLQSYDYLYIRVFSPEKSVEQELASQNNAGGGNDQNSARTDYLNGYQINDSGYVDVPLIGNLMLRGITIHQAEHLVQEAVNKVLINAKVVVKLLSFKVTFMGEVNTGVRYFYQKDLNLLEALATAGGVTTNAKIESVLLLRQEGMAYRSHRIDLSDRRILTDPMFYVKPNDIIYVEPSKSKLWRLKMADYAAVIGTITTTISTLLLVISLSK